MGIERCSRTRHMNCLMRLHLLLYRQIQILLTELFLIARPVVVGRHPCGLLKLA